MSALNEKHFRDEKAARAYIESLMWPEGPICPHCGTLGRASVLKGKSTRPGVYKCYACRKPFSVKVGTIFESSHVKLHVWLQAIFLLCSSKKGIASNQLHRTLGVTLRTAWFMSHRIREAMKSGDLDVFGGGGGAVEADETFYGREPNTEVKPGVAHKMKILSLIDRDTGRARSFVVDDITTATLGPLLENNISYDAHLMTDEAPRYKTIAVFAAHGVVNHSQAEYVSRENRYVHTNTVEGFFSVFKKGMRSIYQHCSKEHLARYTTEFDFRYSNRARLGIGWCLSLNFLGHSVGTESCCVQFLRVAGCLCNDSRTAKDNGHPASQLSQVEA